MNNSVFLDGKFNLFSIKTFFLQTLSYFICSITHIKQNHLQEKKTLYLGIDVRSKIENFMLRTKKVIKLFRNCSKLVLSE